MDRRALALGVYVVTSGDLVKGRGHREVALAAIEGGATAVQLRAPELEDPSLLPLATELARACREAGVLLLVNDRLDVARQSGAHGVHLGQEDELEGARERLGPDRVLGISVTSPPEALAAEGTGADYLGVTV
ncbi:MAG TPA: thiamine phosphate synthase, partial [Actinomycetota bacterium]|nr:thiamine phosphate synthase [Actinomycetota bacterium]